MKESVNQKVWEITVNKVINAKSDLYKNGVTINEYKIIGISKYKVCINSDWFRTFDYKREKKQRRDSHETYLNDISVRIKTKEDYFGNGVFITMYSTKKPTKVILNKMVSIAAIKIDEEYGFLFNGAKDELYDIVSNYELN